LVIAELNNPMQRPPTILSPGELREDPAESDSLNEDDLWRYWLWLDDDDWPWARG
jgi:hypothetical protein